MALSHVWLGLPGGRFQSDGGLRITAATARWWSSSGALRAMCSQRISQLKRRSTSVLESVGCHRTVHPLRGLGEIMEMLFPLCGVKTVCHLHLRSNYETNVFGVKQQCRELQIFFIITRTLKRHSVGSKRSPPRRIVVNCLIVFTYWLINLRCLGWQ